MKATLLFFLAALSCNLQAQLYNWQWARSAGGSPSTEEVKNMRLDPNGNVVIGGEFQSASCTFGANTLSNADNTGGSSDIFIAKYDPAGNVLWAKSAGGGFTEALSGIAVDAGGNVLITGRFFGATCTIGTTTLTNSSIYTEIFLAKFDASGNFLWAKSLAGSSDDNSGGISTDASGNVFISGHYSSPTLGFDNITITNTGPTNYDDAYIAKYDPSGNALWAKNFGGTKSEYCGGISADASGNAYITGSFQSTSITFAGNPLNNSGNNVADIFLCKYDAAGNEVWARKSTGPGGWLAGSGIITNDAAGNVIISGTFASSVIAFGSTTLTLISSANPMGGDIYLVKYDAAGNVLWATSAGGVDVDRPSGLSTDATGNILISGAFSSQTFSFSNVTLSKSSTADQMFIAHCDGLGNFTWATTIAGPANGCRAACANTSGSIYLTGNFHGPSITFGSLPALTNVSNSTNDVFVAKLDVSVISGIEKKNVAKALNMHPNPFSNELFLAPGFDMSGATLTITDGLGRTIREIQDISGNSTIIRRHNLPGGIYFLSLTQEGKPAITEKIIVSD